jgi:hypothetical protein
MKKSCREFVGATTDLSARTSLRGLGLDATRDVTILALGGNTVRFAALQSGSVKAAMMSLPLNIQIKKNGLSGTVLSERFSTSRSRGSSREAIRSRITPNTQSNTVFVCGMKAFKTERASFVSFAQKKFSLSKDVAETSQGA